ncbi:MAG: hypothetical protein ACM3SS_08370, partial [Rhodospirillaceae bacterium]
MIIMTAPIPSFAVYETQAMLGALDEHGAVFVPGVIDAALCVRARAAIDALQPMHWDEAHSDPRGLGGGHHLDRYLCVFNRDPYWLQFLDLPGIIDLAEAALEANCHVIGQTAWRSHPGFHGEAMHADYLPMTWKED